MNLKNKAHYTEDVKDNGHASATSNHEAVGYDQQAEKKLLRRIDKRLVPILGALYSISLVDRVSISSARISGMDKALGLSIGNRYSIALICFFPTYMFFELPSNLVIRKAGGTVVMGQGFVRNYQALAACRALLGFFEAGFFPGVIYLVTCWYTRFEVQQRLAWFYLLSLFLAGWSSILAYGLIQMQGLSGVDGWQWIFIIKGLITQVAAIGAWFLIVDFPDRAKKPGRISKKALLTEEEAKFIAQRIETDRGDSQPDSLSVDKILLHLKDWKLWVFALMFMCTSTPSYALAYFGPVILHNMGYSAGVTNLLSAPPVMFAVLSALIISWLSDKYRIRAPAIAFQACLSVTGLMMTAYCEKNIPRYLGLFFGYAGCQGNVPSMLAYQSNNIRNQSKRAVASALQIGMGGVGGIIASTVFRQVDAPRYITGLWVTTGMQFAILIMVSITTFYFSTVNKKVDAGTLKKPIEGLVGFKYTL